MTGEGGRHGHADIIAGLFAMLTGRLEDGAGIAGDSQARLPAPALRNNGCDLRDLLDEAAILLGAIAALLVDADCTAIADADDK